MCNLYAITKSQEAIRQAAKALRDKAGNLPPLPGIFPDQMAPIVRTGEDGERELVMMRWGLPSPPVFGNPRPVTNVRNVKSAHWKPWLKAEQRCLVPATSFCEYHDKPDPKTKRKVPHWFALSEKRPLFFFAGIWRSWKGTRGTKTEPVEGEHLLYSFLTTDSNKDVKPIHAKAMPVILTTREETDAWLTAPVEKALKLQRPLPAGVLKIVARGKKKDAA
jgi:putative SOS response-associated peptidase YedK